MEHQNSQMIGAQQHNQLVSFKSLDQLKTWALEIVKSDICPLKEPNDVVAAVLYGNDLGIPPMVALNNVYPINGRGSLSVHIMNALLQTKGVTKEILHNYEPCVNFVMKGDDGLPVLFKPDGSTISKAEAEKLSPEERKTIKPLITRVDFISSEARDHEVKGKQIVDYKTVVRFKRKIRQPDGTWEPEISEGSFSYQEAVQAGLFEKRGNVWKSYTRTMTYNRAFSNGAKIAGGDIFLGMDETSELADVHNISYTTSDGNKITILDPKSKEEPKATIKNTEDAVILEEKGESTTNTAETNTSDSPQTS